MMSRSRILLAVAVLACPAILAQEIKTPTVVAIPTSTPPTFTLSSQPISHQVAPALGLKASESQRLFSVSVGNSGSTPMSVLGVQTSNGLYAVQFPAVIPPRGSGSFSLLYYASAGTAGVADVMRVLTDQGLIEVEIDHARDPSVQFSVSTLQWQQGQALTAKAVTITVAAGVTSVPVNAFALGGSPAQVTLVSTGAGSYRLSITPNSTAKPATFPVVVQFQPDVPDVVPVITCSVVGN